MDDSVKLDIDVAYRRGFDHALAFLFLEAGASQRQINKLLYKKRVAEWRGQARGWIYDLRQDAPRATQEEISEVTLLMSSLFMGEGGDDSDA